MHVYCFLAPMSPSTIITPTLNNQHKLLTEVCPAVSSLLSLVRVKWNGKSPEQLALCTSGYLWWPGNRERIQNKLAKVKGRTLEYYFLVAKTSKCTYITGGSEMTQHTSIQKSKQQTIGTKTSCGIQIIHAHVAHLLPQSRCGTALIGHLLVVKYCFKVHHGPRVPGLR